MSSSRNTLELQSISVMSSKNHVATINQRNNVQNQILLLLELSLAQDPEHKKQDLLLTPAASLQILSK